MDIKCKTNINHFVIEGYSYEHGEAGAFPNSLKVRLFKTNSDEYEGDLWLHKNVPMGFLVKSEMGTGASKITTELIAYDTSGKCLD